MISSHSRIVKNAQTQWVIIVKLLSKKFENYFFFNVKKDRFLGSSPGRRSPWPAGSVWARPEAEPEAPASATELMALTH